MRHEFMSALCNIQRNPRQLESSSLVLIRFRFRTLIGKSEYTSRKPTITVPRDYDQILAEIPVKDNGKSLDGI